MAPRNGHGPDETINIFDNSSWAALEELRHAEASAYAPIDINLVFDPIFWEDQEVPERRWFD